MTKKDTKKVKTSDKEKELIFCHGRLEQYWMLLNDKINKRKLKGKKAERISGKLIEWEALIFKEFESNT